MVAITEIEAMGFFCVKQRLTAIHKKFDMLNYFMQPTGKSWVDYCKIY